MMNLTNISMNGNTSVDGAGVANYYASFSKSGGYQVQLNTQDKAAYEANKETVDADFETFQKKAEEFSKFISETD